MGYSYGYIADLERDRQKPSREFLERIKERFGTSIDYILYGQPFYLWAGKVEEFIESLESVPIPKDVAEKIRSDAMSAMTILAENKYDQGFKEGMKISEPEMEYKFLPRSTKKLLDAVKEILESGNKVMIDGLKANIKVLMEAIRVTKNTDQNKGGYQSE